MKQIDPNNSRGAQWIGTTMLRNCLQKPESIAVGHGNMKVNLAPKIGDKLGPPAL